MQQTNRIKIVVAMVTTVVAIVACTDIGTGSGASGGGFQKKYFDARNALEEGNYDTAIRRYNSLLEQSGPLESRLRLEMSHALLRADRYDEAATQARAVASTHEDNRRAAALAVVGTSEHRLAQEAMTRQDFGPETIAHLRRAEAAFAEMLRVAPDLDPLGSMSERQEMVAASLKRLGA